jgi:hypothetical protein
VVSCPALDAPKRVETAHAQEAGEQVHQHVRVDREFRPSRVVQTGRAARTQLTGEQLAATHGAGVFCCRGAPEARADCVAEVVGLEPRNVGAKYPFERSHGFPGIQPNSGHRDYSRLSCGVGDTQLEAGSAGIKRSARR